MTRMLSTQEASRQYATRPPDERFPSLKALIDFSQHEKECSVERTYNLRDLRAVPVNTHNTERFDATPAQASVQLESPKGREDVPR